MIVLLLEKKRILRLIMASRAILRRKSVVSEYLNISTRSIQTLQNLGHGDSTQNLGESHSHQLLSYAANQFSQDLDSRRKNGCENILANEELMKFSAQRLFRSTYYGITPSGCVNRKLELLYPMGTRLMSQSIRYKSATAGQRDLGNEDDQDNDEMVAKKRKEASPEECDQAVEGLSSAKAKAKAKKLLESQKAAKSVLQRIWATILGIGPALRAVASMSRLGIFFSHIIYLFLLVLKLNS